MKALFLCIALFSYVHIFAQFSGIVFDSSTTKAVPFATIYIVELQTGTIADSSGSFTLSSSVNGKIHLQISSVGYSTSVFLIDVSKIKQRSFSLTKTHLNISEIVVSTPVTKLQSNTILPIVKADLESLEQSAPSNLAEAVSKIPGVANYSTGPGIGKPVIRGLSANRIVVYSMGIRLENQQWGDEHGLGLNPVGIENVEIIKGPSSLLYGADALGGVLYFVEERYAPLNSIQTSVIGNFHSNSTATFNRASLKVNRKNLKLNLFGGYNSAADYKTPDLNRVFNSRFNESTFKGSIGFHSKKWIGNLRYSFLKNEFGISESDTMVNSKNRKAVLPFQTIHDHLVSLENVFFTGNTKINTTLGYNSNNRGEFEEYTDAPGLNLDLKTFTYNIRSHSYFLDDKVKLVSGIQGMYQQNKNGAEEILIPDAVINDIGVFIVGNYSPLKRISIESGIRFDNRSFSTSEMQTDEIYFPELDRGFNSFNYSLGSSFNIRKLHIGFSIATGFRAPNSSELLSNGVHEGTLRYEIGDPALKSERGIQLDAILNFRSEHFELMINPFVNFIDNYIFLSSTDSFINDYPVFNYDQSEARLFGGELGFHWHPHPIDWLHIESAYSAVFAEDDSGDPFPLIPANKIRTHADAVFQQVSKKRNTNLYIEYTFHFRQSRTAEFESQTPSYHLLNAGTELEFNLGKNRWWRSSRRTSTPTRTRSSCGPSPSATTWGSSSGWA